MVPSDDLAAGMGRSNAELSGACCGGVVGEALVCVVHGNHAVVRRAGFQGGGCFGPSSREKKVSRSMREAETVLLHIAGANLVAVWTGGNEDYVSYLSCR